MFCKNCGTDIPGDSKFCPACGASVSEEKNVGQPDGLNTKATAENTNRTGKAPTSKIKVVGKIFLGIILLLLLICSSTFRSLVFIFAVIMIPVSLGIFVVGLIRKTPKKKWGIIFAVSFILAVVFSSGISSTADPIVGRWEGLFYEPKDGDVLFSDDIGDFSCVVNKDGKTVISMPNKITDGELTFYVRFSEKETERNGTNDRLYDVLLTDNPNDTDVPINGFAAVSGDTLSIFLATDSGVTFTFTK